MQGSPCCRERPGEEFIAKPVPLLNHHCQIYKWIYPILYITILNGLFGRKRNLAAQIKDLHVRISRALFKLQMIKVWFFPLVVYESAKLRDK